MTSTTPTKKKIPLPGWWNESQLDKQTLAYWYLATAWHGTHPKGMSVGDALSDARELSEQLNPERPLAKKVELIRYDIVTYGCKSNKRRKSKEPEACTLAKIVII